MYDQTAAQVTAEKKLAVSSFSSDIVSITNLTWSLKMKNWSYCKTVADGIPCIGLEGKEGEHYCYYHNSPEFCKKAHEQQAAQNQSSGETK